MSKQLHEAASMILANDGKVPKAIKRVNLCPGGKGRRVWTPDNRGEHGKAGQYGYEVDGVAYRTAVDILTHARMTCI